MWNAYLNKRSKPTQAPAPQASFVESIEAEFSDTSLGHQSLISFIQPLQIGLSIPFINNSTGSLVDVIQERLRIKLKLDTDKYRKPK